VTELLLNRTRQTSECTVGVLILPGGRYLHTLELPWVPDPGYPGGKPDVSCVPRGLYQLVLHDTVKHPKSFALVNPALGVIHEPDVWNPNFRVACLIHVANTVQELEGCIGLGMNAAGCTVSSSRAALEYFNSQVPWVAGHQLEIA
jgi:hypothetical protein